MGGQGILIGRFLFAGTGGATKAPIYHKHHWKQKREGSDHYPTPSPNKGFCIEKPLCEK